jgi:hypothetical protein
VEVLIAVIIQGSEVVGKENKLTGKTRVLRGASQVKKELTS